MGKRGPKPNMERANRYKSRIDGGMSITDLARQESVSRSTIQGYLRRAGYYKDYRSPAQRVREYLSTHEFTTREKVAWEVGVGRSTVARVLDDKK